MKAPDAALVRGRAKVAPADASVLHLESAGVHCLRGLEVCARLRSLYASENPLRSIVEVSSLPTLWRIELSHTPIRELAPLATFAALGFLYLEHGSLTFADLCCLREVHVLELRVAGNPALLPSSSSLTGEDSARVYRERVVALLPNIWALDGHFVSTRERALAIEREDAFVMELLLGPSPSSSSSGGPPAPAMAFGSSSTLWAPHLLRVRSDSSLHTTSTSSLSSDNGSTAQRPPLDAMTLLRSLEAEPTRRPELQDLHRLRVLLSLHDRECDVHNASCHLAPSRHSPSARPLPRVRVNELLALSRRSRLAIAALLAARLEFQLPSRVVADALTLVLLSSEQQPTDSASIAPDELAQLPPYALTGLLACLRDHALQEEDTLRHRAQFSVHNAWDEFDARLWRSMPAVFTSLLAMDKDQRLSALARTARGGSRAAQGCLYVSDTEAESFSLRCAYAVSLLAKAASCPGNSSASSLSPSRIRAYDTATDSRRSSSTTAAATTTGENSHASSLELAELRHAARAAPTEALEAVGITPPLAFVGTDSTVTGRSAVAALPWRRKPVERDYRRPWNEAPSTIADDQRVVATAERARGARQSATETTATRRPRPGEWIEVLPKTFLRVRCVSDDQRYVSASAHAEAHSSSSSDVVSIRVDRLVRVSGSMWRLSMSHNAATTDDTDDEALTRLLQRLRSGRETATRLGRLHRESEAFHRHGAARTQGFPNRDVTSADLRSLGPTTAAAATELLPVPRPVELFAAHDTLDANYVLTSPSLVAIQNACATRAFQSERRPPAGLWGPIEVPSFQVASVNSLAPPNESKQLGKEHERGSLGSLGRTLAVEQPEAEENDWQTLQHDLAALLRRQDDATRRRKSAQKMEDVPCFLTRLPDEQDGGNDDSTAAAAVVSPPPDATKTLDKSASAPTLLTATQTTRSQSNHKQRAGVGPLAPLWHHVPTKPQLLVAAAAPSASPSPQTRQSNNGAPPRGIGDEERAGQRAGVSGSHKPSVIMPRAATLTLSLPSLPVASPPAPARC